MVDLDIQQVAINKLSHDPANARVHKKRSLEALKASLLTFGQRKPVVATSEYVVIAGNGTLAAAKDLGWENLSVAFLPADWSSEQIRAYALADNSVATLSSWDEDLLKGSLESLIGFDVDLEVMGLPRLLEDLPELDEVQEFEIAKIVVEQGQLWSLGEHRLLCGDSSISESYQIVMAGELADCIWTDPPYGVSLEEAMKNHPIRGLRVKSTILNDELGVNQLKDFLSLAFGHTILHTHPGSAWYIAAPATKPVVAFMESLSELDIWRHTLVWAKDRMVFGRSDYHYQHEFIFYGWTPGTHHWHGDRKQTTIFNVAKPAKSEEHPTMKPIELISEMLRNSTKEGDLILDPFAGSGSTLLAAQQLGRRAALIEIEPHYCQVIIARWERLTGQKAVLINGKETKVKE